MAPIRTMGESGRCNSIASAPLWRSPLTSRITTKGSRNTAATSYALNVGAQIPSSGLQTNPHPVPAPVLTSA